MISRIVDFSSLLEILVWDYADVFLEVGRPHVYDSNFNLADLASFGTDAPIFVCHKHVCQETAAFIIAE